jgi:hypothetical protein
MGTGSSFQELSDRSVHSPPCSADVKDLCNMASTASLVSLYDVKVKVKCTLAKVLRLCTGRTAHRVGVVEV